MSLRPEALSVAFTGQLLFLLAAAAVLALAASGFFLYRYRRAVIRSMRRRSRDSIAEPTGHIPPETGRAPHETPIEFKLLSADSLRAGDRRKNRLYRRARSRPWLAALVYAAAGCAFAAVMTVAHLRAAGLEFLPRWFLFLIWVYGWPALLTINLTAAVSKRAAITVCAGYLLVGGALLARSPDLTAVQLTFLWFNANAIPSVLILVFFNRYIRAVGPLVLVLMLFGVAGAHLVISLAGSDPKLLRAYSAFAGAIGLDAASSFWGLPLFGFLVFAIVGGLVLGRLRRRYERKQLSERSIQIDMIWLLFAIVNSIQMAAQGPRWILSGFVAFGVFKIAAGIGFLLPRGRRHAQAPGPRLLLFRVFALGRRTETLSDALGKPWRTVGSVQLIGGPRLATSALALHEFLDFLSGKLARRFIDSGSTLDLRVAQMDLQPDRDGQFRVSGFFCHDDTWKLTLARLADDSDAVLVDLRGFSGLNHGSAVAIQELFNRVRLDRLVFAFDDTTDEPFLRRSMEQAWRELGDLSPNRRVSPAQVTLVRLSGSSGAMRQLLYPICAAANASLNETDRK